MKQRQIKFRNWDKEHKVMGDGIPIEGGATEMLALSNRATVMLIIHEDLYKKYVLMQFTGLTDKNGKEIYEGDILSKPGFTKISRTPCVEYYKIKWDEVKACFMADEMYFPVNLTQGFGKECEIIGNIYENPDLLK